jgi:hypothetical protein
MCRCIAAANRPKQRCLSLTPVDVGKRQLSLADDPMEHRLVEITLHCAGNDWQRLIPEQRKLLRPWRASLGQEGIGKRYATVNQRLCLGKNDCGLDVSAFGVRLEQENFVQSNSFVAQQVSRVGANQHLPTSPTLHACEQLRQEADHIWVQREFGLLEQERAEAV